MNNDIKEILDYYKKDNEKYEKNMLNSFNKKQLETAFNKSYQRYKNHKILLDYITDLQEENDELRKNQRFHKKLGNDYIFCLEGDKETYKDMVLMYQERIEKAIEKINDIIKLQETVDGVLIPTRYSSIKDILEGENNE